MFLVGRAALDYATFSRVSRSRLVGVVLLAATVPATRHLPAIGVAPVTAAVLCQLVRVVADSPRAPPRHAHRADGIRAELTPRLQLAFPLPPLRPKLGSVVG